MGSQLFDCAVSPLSWSTRSGKRWRQDGSFKSPKGSHRTGIRWVGRGSHRVPNQSSHLVNAVTDSGGTTRCATGQSFIMESGDDQPSGYGGSTEARRDPSCANEDLGPLWWRNLDVQARKYDGNRLCDLSPVGFTDSARSVGVSDSALCGIWPSSDIFTIGTHGATRPESGSSVRRELSYTNKVTTY